MKKLIISFCFLSLNACVVKPTFIPQVPTVTSIQEPLPTTPESVILPSEVTKGGSWAVPIEQGECIAPNKTIQPVAPAPCPAVSGILISEEKAARSNLYVIKYNELRLNYEADRKLWEQQRELYDASAQQMQKQIEDLQPTWFEQNSLFIGIAGGFLLGALTVGLSVGLTK